MSSKPSANRDKESKHTCSRCGETIEREKGFTQDYCEDCKIERAKEGDATEIEPDVDDNDDDNGQSIIETLSEKLPF